MIFKNAWPIFGEDEIEAVVKVLRSGKVNYWTGNEGRLFEKEFADYFGVKHAVAFSNGTAALEAALFALDIGLGDEVIVPCRTFIASASCVVMRGASPIMADIDPISQNLTVETIRAALTPKTKAIIVVHLVGWPCDMDAIMAFAQERKLKVIEDCAQSHGAKYKGKFAGAWGDIAAFSFCQDKIMTTGGEGGMLTTNNPQIWKRVWAFKDHGKSYDAVFNQNHGPGFRWLHESFGTNMRMTEMQAAIGRIQLSKLSDWSATRQHNAGILNSFFSSIPSLRVTLPNPDIKHAYYKYYVFLRSECLKTEWDRDRIMKAIEDFGVSCQSGSCGEIYLEKAFEAQGFRPSVRYKVAKELSETSLVFLVHPTLTEHNMKNTCEVVKKVLELAALKQDFQTH